MKRTISIMLGKGSIHHNERKFTAENVDKERSKNNVTYYNEDIKTVYHKLFDDALKKYNERQKRNDRMINDYYEKIRTSKQEKPFYEIIVQVGDKNNMSAVCDDGQTAKNILDSYIKNFQQRNPHLYVFSAHLHMDEATPHLHIDFVPFTTDSKRGLDTRVSMKSALKQQGFTGTARSDTEFNQWINFEKEKLSEIMLEYGIEWEKKRTHERHKSISQFKREKLVEAVNKLEYKKKSLKYDISKYQNSEKYALNSVTKLEKKAELLPEPTVFMSAKKYKNEVTMPFIEELLTTIKELSQRAFIAEKNAEKLQKQFYILKQRNEQLKKENWDNNMEISKCKVELRKFDKLKSYLGIESVNEIIKAAYQSKINQKEHTQEIIK
jgi:hypothetical protein